MGLGYIGLPTAIIAAKHGVQVTGVDINPKVVEMTNQGHLHIVEPGMEEMLQDVVRSGALHASTTPAASDAHFTVAPTQPHAPSSHSLRKTTSTLSSRLRRWAQPTRWRSSSSNSAPSCAAKSI